MSDDEEYRWRKLVFDSHNCLAKYGDDGEMYCGRCRIDFRRYELETIEQMLLARTLKLIYESRELKERKDV